MTLRNQNQEVFSISGDRGNQWVSVERDIQLISGERVSAGGVRGEVVGEGMWGERIGVCKGQGACVGWREGWWVQAGGDHCSGLQRPVSSGFTQMTRHQNFDVTPGKHWTVFIVLSIGCHVKFDTCTKNFDVSV